MQDMIDQLLGFLKGIWNKRWHAMLIAWLVCIVGWVVVYDLPDQYESNAKIYIDTQSLLKPLLAKMTVQADVRTELNLMVRTLLTRPNIEKIIRLADLDLTVNNEKEFDGLVETLQNKITFARVSQSKSSQINLYDLSYTTTDPEVSQRIVQSVITVFVENSIGNSSDDAESAKTFIAKQIKLYEKRLSESESRLKVFKQKNMGVLPSSTGDYYARMEQSKEQLESTKLLALEIDKAHQAAQKELNALIRSAKNSENTSLTTSYDERIEKLETDLDALLLQYTDNHPDIKGLQRVLSDLQAKRKIELNSIHDSASKGNGLGDNMVYQEIKISLGNMESQKAALNVRLIEYEKRYNELVKLNDIIPEIEAQLTALNRDYNITQEKYNELLSRKESLNLSESINKSSDGIQFKVVEAPRVALNPVGPDRVLLSSMVLLFSFISGIGVAFLLSQIKPVFNSAREVEQMFGLPILGTVSAVTSPGQRKRRMLLIMTYLSLIVLLLLMYVAVVIFYVDDLSLLIKTALEL